jgi:Carboxypeptidase regulatory-like domain
MRTKTNLYLLIAAVFAVAITLSLSVPSAVAQETTGGLQGTVKDSSGAVVAGAKVVVVGDALVGSKEIDTDTSGYYRFANLPPGPYTITVTAKGFRTIKRGVTIEIGHLPSLDFSLEIGTSETIIEVTAQVPLIDVTTARTMTNVTDDIVKLIPHGESFQSVIQFAPSARNEPLMGGNAYNNFAGTGGCSPTGCSNGGAAGYQVGGAADSENGYLVEGQDTANVIGGYSHTNVPFDFIDEVQVKSSGIEAEHGGALGGVANVVMKKGGNNWHGSVVAQFNSSGLNGSPNAYARYNPTGPTSTTSAPILPDPDYQNYQPKKDSTKDFLPGFTLGGPIKKDRLWFFVGFNPELIKLRRIVDFSSQGLGSQKFDQNQQTYYTNGRLDASVTKNIRLYASWLYQYQRESGQVLPRADSVQGFSNVSSTSPLFVFAHGLGYTAPNHTTNVGADFTVTPRLVATTRFGYFFEDYKDFGFPSSGVTDFWNAAATAATTDVNGNCFGNPTTPPSGGCASTNVAPQLIQSTGFFTAANNINTTVRNANQHHQFNQDLAWFKSGLWGTHNFKFGYQLNHLSNGIFQRWNQPAVLFYPGSTQAYAAAGQTGFNNCAALVAANGVQYGDPAGSSCTGTYGYALVQDYGSYGYASSYNHGFFLQDSWTIGKGITITAGFRLEKEYLPGETTAGGFPAKPIQFGWGDKIAPRLGAAWDVLRNGKMKLFGGYGVFNDIMKLNLAISSFGGQYWHNCAYALMTPDPTVVNPAFDSSGFYCTGDSATEAHFAGGSTPAGLIFLENQNFRGTEGVAPGLKPYRQHESTLGMDYQVGKNLALEARWDRRRLDHAIEDAALFDPTGSEVFTIVNPGEGQNKVNTTCSASAVPPLPAGVPPCPPNIKAERSYDGLEIRLTKAHSKHWFGMFSYTYSRLYGNYAGLTSTDLSDAGGGRNSPNNSRSFDETYFQWSANGTSSSGPLATDRPHAFKGYAYYEVPEGGRNSTAFGIFSYAYSGSPMTSYLDVGYSYNGGAFPVYVEGRGKWADVTQDLATGNITVNGVSARRTPWFTQSDLNVSHTFKMTESKALSFSATFSNLFNQRATTAYYSQIDTAYYSHFIAPGGVPFYFGGEAYSAYEHAYDWKTLINTSCNGGCFSPAGGGPITVNNQYGQPYLYQLSRNIRLGLRFTF